jgi:hypothetical protein
VPKG